MEQQNPGPPGVSRDFATCTLYYICYSLSSICGILCNVWQVHKAVIFLFRPYAHRSFSSDTWGNQEVLIAVPFANLICPLKSRQLSRLYIQSAARRVTTLLPFLLLSPALITCSDTPRCVSSASCCALSCCLAVLKDHWAAWTPSAKQRASYKVLPYPHILSHCIATVNPGITRKTASRSYISFWGCMTLLSLEMHIWNVALFRLGHSFDPSDKSL